MGAAQIFYGHFGFDSPTMAARAVEALSLRLREHAPIVMPHVRHDDHVVSVRLDGSMPSSLWHPVGACLDMLGENATGGHVSMLHVGERPELAVAMAQGTPWAAPVRVTRPCRWWPTDRPASPALVGGEGVPPVFDPVAHGDARGIGMRDWLGIFCDLYPDGDAIWHVPEGEAPAGRSTQAWADLDRVPSARLVAFPHKETLSVVRVVGTEDVVAGGRTYSGALRIDVEIHDVMRNATDLREGGRTPSIVTLWLADGEGLVALATG